MKKEIKYSTIEEQIKKLESQKLTINDYDFAKANLQLFGYSNLIKSYREPYVIKTNDKITYRSGVTFEQIHSLYILDKYLRNAVMASMQDLEEHIKETAASVIAKSFGTNQVDYLEYRNYKNTKKRKERFTLPNILDTFKSTLNTDKNPIHHYSSTYENVPPWILFKSVYFSTIVNFIDLFKPNEQIKLAHRLYNSKKLKLSDEALCTLMIDTLYICLDYRNMAAHGGRIYNHKSKYKLKTDKIFNLENHVKVQGFSQLLFLLNLFEYKHPYQQLYSALEEQLTRHCNYFPQDITYLGQILNINIIPKEMVFISDRSNIFHIIPHCSGIKDSTAISIDDAKNSGYIPCKKCMHNFKM